MLGRIIVKNIPHNPISTGEEEEDSTIIKTNSNGSDNLSESNDCSPPFKDYLFQLPTIMIRKMNHYANMQNSS